MEKFKNKTALVTGSGQGMGLGIVKLLASQGAHVLVNDLVPEKAEKAAEEIRSLGGNATPAPFDVTSSEMVNETVKELRSKVGTIDILVNNAGNAGGSSKHMEQVDFKDTSPEDWTRYIAVNLNGVLNCTHAVLSDMCEKGWGRVITISSDAGRIGLPIRVSLYGAAKAGAAHLMRHVSHEVGPYGVTTNTLALGLMNNNEGGEWAESMIQTIPMRRMGSPEDVAHAVSYLSSDEASWITGQTLVLNGGSTTI
ncbi:MAG: SDR family oxidoreductase [Cyclobacteriaceae bacterium]